jgi:heptosyltransferase-2
MKSILVIRGGALGDFLVTLPALRLLRERWPEAHFELMGYPRLAELALRRYYLDAVRSVDHGPLAAFFSNKSILDPKLMDYFGDFDLILSYFFDPDGIFQANLRKCQVPHLLLGSPKVERGPAAAHFCAPLAEIGLSTTDYQSRLKLLPEDEAAAAEFLDQKPSPFWAIHPGSGSPAKNWPIARWLELARRLEQSGRKILWIAGEADTEVFAAIRQARPDAWIADHLPLPTLAAVLQRAALFLGHDSGITHLAASVDTPSLALFGPTSPSIWAPLGDHVTTLQKGPAISDITVDDVWEAATRLR